MQTFYSNGKLLITGEYVVLDGALSLALPTKFGQSLIIESINDQKLVWKSFDEKEEIARIVARIPLSLKEDIREYIKNNREETESTLVLKGLKKLGFNIDLKWTIDRRKLR